MKNSLFTDIIDRVKRRILQGYTSGELSAEIRIRKANVDKSNAAAYNMIPKFTPKMEAYIIKCFKNGLYPRHVTESLMQEFSDWCSDVENQPDSDHDLKLTIYNRIRNRRYDKRYSAKTKIKKAIEDEDGE